MLPKPFCVNVQPVTLRLFPELAIAPPYPPTFAVNVQSLTVTLLVPVVYIPDP